MIPDPARYAKDAADAIGAVFTDLDDGGGYLIRISKNGRSVVVGAGGVSSFPVNSATAFTLSRDKSHTKSVLRSVGVPVIGGKLFFAHTLRAGLRGPGWGEAIPDPTGELGERYLGAFGQAAGEP